MLPRDEEVALQAVSSLSDPSDAQVRAQADINAILNDGGEDPFIDIHELFRLYNVLYFRGLLLPQVEVAWSSRLTLHAGMCELIRDKQDGTSRIRLKLSEPLLKFRPRSDTINTLLHESIHAYFFVTTTFHSRDDGHGPPFQLLADAINSHGNYTITVFHQFHDEVNSYRTHVWQCDGKCREWPPYFGLVKRTMNRPPGKGDNWWAKHQSECGGTYVKIAEPEKSKKQLEAMSRKERAGRQKNKIDGWVKVGVKEVGQIGPGEEKKSPSASLKRSIDSDESSTVTKKQLVSCPICDKGVDASDINEHLDTEHQL